MKIATAYQNIHKAAKIVIANTLFNKLFQNATQANYLECFIVALVLETRWFVLHSNS